MCWNLTFNSVCFEFILARVNAERTQLRNFFEIRFTVQLQPVRQNIGLSRNDFTIDALYLNFASRRIAHCELGSHNTFTRMTDLCALVLCERLRATLTLESHNFDTWRIHCKLSDLAEHAFRLSFKLSQLACVYTQLIERVVSKLSQILNRAGWFEEKPITLELTLEIEINPVFLAGCFFITLRNCFGKEGNSYENSI